MPPVTRKVLREATRQEQACSRHRRKFDFETRRKINEIQLEIRTLEQEVVKRSELWDELHKHIRKLVVKKQYKEAKRKRRFLDRIDIAKKQAVNQLSIKRDQLYGFRLKLEEREFGSVENNILAKLHSEKRRGGPLTPLQIARQKEYRWRQLRRKRQKVLDSARFHHTHEV